MLALFLLACAASSPTPVPLPVVLEPVEPDWVGIVETYQSMPLVAEAEADPAAGYLCRMPTPGVETLEHSNHLRVHANSVALEAFAKIAGPRAFPVGSIIVKEKVAKKNPPVLATYNPGIGVMVKRERGYAPKAHDWQYALLEDGQIYTKPEHVGHCATCHSQADFPVEREARYGDVYLSSARDAVFLSGKSVWVLFGK